MSIEALLDRLVTAVEANTQALQVLEAGRQASLAQLQKAAEAGDTAAPKTRGRKKADAEPAAPAAGDESAAPVETPASAATTTAPAGTTADGLSAVEEELKAAVTAYIGSPDDGQAARTENIKAIMAHFGGKLVGPQSTLDDEQRKQAVFYVKRYAAGQAVDFSQDYDFDGDPTQGAAAAADEFDIG